MPNLKGLDVSRTDIDPIAFVNLLSSSPSLNILCALCCPLLQQDAILVAYPSYYAFGKLLIADFTNISKELANLLYCIAKKERNIFSIWRKLKGRDWNSYEIMAWVEWILSHSLMRIAQSNLPGLDDFWISQGAELLLSLLQSSQEDVQERAANGVSSFVIDHETAAVNGERAEAVKRCGGLSLLVKLARTWRKGLQLEVAKAIAKLSLNANVAQAVTEEGGASILTAWASSPNWLVAEEAAGGLYNLSIVENNKGAIADAGGVKALIDLIFKWSDSRERLLEYAAGALANLAADETYSLKITMGGGVPALVMLVRDCKSVEVQEKAACALGTLAAHPYSSAAVGQEPGALAGLLQLTQSPDDLVSEAAAGALVNLLIDERNVEAIAAAGGVGALIALADSCSDATPVLAERAARALWGLSESETNKFAIGQEGGIEALIRLAASDNPNVHENAAGALWNLAYNPINARRILDVGGVPVLCFRSISSESRMARFVAALALAFICEGRNKKEIAKRLFSSLVFYRLAQLFSCMEELGTSLEGAYGIAYQIQLREFALTNIEEVPTYFSPELSAAASAFSDPAALTQISEAARIQEAGHLRCCGAEIGRFAAMLKNPCPKLMMFAAFALLQFTVPSSQHALHHVTLLREAGATRILCDISEAAAAPTQAKILAKIVLQNIARHQIEHRRCLANLAADDRFSLDRKGWWSTCARDASSGLQA